MTNSPECSSAASEHPQISFLREAANYFRNRPTHGEDSAFWSNVANADNCEKAANLIERMLDAAQSVRVSDEQRAALERMAGHDPRSPGLSWDKELVLIQSAAHAARDVLASLSSQPSPAATVETKSQAKEPQANGQKGSPTVRGVRVGEASADLPATSELMDVTAGETAPHFHSSAGNAGLRATLEDIVAAVPANHGGTQGAIRKAAVAALEQFPLTEAQPQAMPVWQPIETAPKTAGCVLIAGGTFESSMSLAGECAFTGPTIASYDVWEKLWKGDNAGGHDEFYWHKPTHWMPMPDASQLSRPQSSTGEA